VRRNVKINKIVGFLRRFSVQSQFMSPFFTGAIRRRSGCLGLTGQTSHQNGDLKIIKFFWHFLAAGFACAYEARNMFVPNLNATKAMAGDSSPDRAARWFRISR
jgi:hypothetical protein